MADEKRRFGFRRSKDNVVIPYFLPYPVPIGGGFYPALESDMSAEAAQASYGSLAMPPQQQAPPPVTMDQYAAEIGQTSSGILPTRLGAQACPSTERTESTENRAPEAWFYIALKDHFVYTAVAYWIESGTLHYITRHGSQNQISLELVDRQTSTRLNAGRRIELALPQ